MVGATVFFETALPPSTSILLTRQGRVGGVVFTKNKSFEKPFVSGDRTTLNAYT